MPELVEKGIQLVTVSELLSFHKDGAQPGMVYSRLSPEEKQAMEAYCQGYMAFLDAGKTERDCVRAAVSLAREQGLC